MKQFISSILEGEHKNRNRIIILTAAGIFLLLLNIPNPRTKSSSEPESSSEKKLTFDEKEKYAHCMEERLCSILKKVEGVGKVEVMLTLKSSSEAVLNKDVRKEINEEDNTQEDIRTGKRSSQIEQETILSNASGDEAPFVIKEIEPEIAGVLIAFEGADSEVTKASVIEAASVLFGLPTNHIKVLKLEVTQ